MIFESLELEHDTLYAVQQYRLAAQLVKTDPSWENRHKMYVWADIVASGLSRDLEEQGA